MVQDVGALSDIMIVGDDAVDHAYALFKTNTAERPEMPTILLTEPGQSGTSLVGVPPAKEILPRKR